MAERNYKLRAYWSKRKGDLMFDYPLGVMTSADASYLSGIFNKDFIQELENRGYDTTKIKFEIPIQLPENHRSDKFATLLNEYKRSHQND